MKLLCLTHSLSEVDGVGKYGTEVLRRVAPRCDAVEVLLARKHRGLSDRLPPGLDVQVALPPDYLLYLSWPKFAAYVAAAMPKVWAAVGRADLVHALSDYPHAWLAVEAAKARGKPVVVSGHGTYSVAPFRYPGHRRLIRRAYGRADALLLGSRFALSKLEEKARFERARVVRYGVDPTQADGARDLAPPPSTPERFVLTIGEL
ncbi:MAG: glycosyltransferase, partial [Planctomycetota bacterium JB042]